MARRGPFDDISDLSRLTHAPPAEQLFADPRGIELAQRKYDSTADEFFAQHAAARRLVEDARQHPRPRYDDVEPLPRRYYDEPDLSPRNANPRTPHTTTRFQDRYDPRAENYPESPSRSYNPPNPNPMSPNININTPTRTRIPITQDWPDNPPRSTPSREQAYTRREEVGMALEEKIKARQAAYRYTLA